MICERFGRLFVSPGPIYEPEGKHDDAWRASRSLHAAGFVSGDIVLNTFSYHLVPGGFIMDGGARCLGCTVIPAGPGNTEQQLDVIEHLKPVAYTGTADFLKILLDAADAAGRDVSSIKKAVVSGAAFPPSLQAIIKARGIDAYQAYAIADVGVIAYESRAREGLIVNEDVLIEIVRPGTGIPVADGEVGEVVVTSFRPGPPMDSAWQSVTCRRSCPAYRRAAVPTRVSRVGWVAPIKRRRSKGCSCDPNRWPKLARRHRSWGACAWWSRAPAKWTR